MLVYGDQVERVDPAQRLADIASDLSRLPADGIARHQQLVAALVESGRILQALADRGVEAGLEPFLLDLARAICRSWDRGFKAAAAEPELPRLPELPPLPAEAELRVPEGYAFYALYPEAYALAARRLVLKAPPRIIGIRSIGTSLAAMAAAALDTSTFFTVRPGGNPFDRQLTVPAQTEGELLAGSVHYVIVDEGPGQSGSSFAAVADWLHARGVPPDRIAFLPSHAGDPGPQATARARSIWSVTQRQVADLGPELPAVLAGWAAGLLGELDAPLEEMSGGAWRPHLLSSDEWPAANPGWERRKFLARAGGETWLLKFAGLGEAGARKLERARRLHAARWTAAPRGLIHGFLVERWHGDARPLSPGQVPIAAVADYLRQRSALGEPSLTGASAQQLLAMAKRNISLEMGPELGGRIGRFDGRIEALSQRMRPIRSDGRMLAHEWLRLADGKLIKTDALDHDCAHDLIGCQDLAWDIVGAAVELGYDAADLAARIGRPVDSELLDFMILAYLAFRLGQTRLSAQMTAADPAEQARFQVAAEAYAATLRSRLAAGSHARPWP